jgi:puromycin-sensitive aminopeptidase
MAGFYRSTYNDYQGVEKIVASTQFEALDARRAFPCVDEPAAKATFVVTLVNIPSSLECFSNMPEASRVTKTTTTSSSSSSVVTISFLETPKMSTYLLAFCIGEFDYLQGQTKHGVLIKVYAPKGRSASGQYALQCALQCLDAYDDFFGIPYPLPKLDMVAIPEFVRVPPPPQYLLWLLVLMWWWLQIVFVLLVEIGRRKGEREDPPGDTYPSTHCCCCCCCCNVPPTLYSLLY